MKTKLLLLFFCATGNLFAQTVTVDSIIQTSPCAGSDIYIPYTVSGGLFNFGNVFTAQLSDFTGSFNTFTNIGSIPYWSSAMIIGTIPNDATLGLYKVRIVASSPADTSPPSPNDVIVTSIAELSTIQAFPADTFCEGDSTTLSVLPVAQDYIWSTGETTADITVTQSGDYTVTVTDFLGCKTSSDPYTVTALDCDTTGILDLGFEDLGIRIYPNPSEGVFQLSVSSYQLSVGKIEIYNILGEKIYQTPITDYRLPVTISLNLSAGIYFLKIQTEEKIFTKKILIEK